MNNERQNEQLLGEGRDWLQVCLGTALYVALAIAAAALHAWVSGTL